MVVLGLNGRPAAISSADIVNDRTRFAAELPAGPLREYSAHSGFIYAHI